MSEECDTFKAGLISMYDTAFTKNQLAATARGTAFGYWMEGDYPNAIAWNNEAILQLQSAQYYLIAYNPFIDPAYSLLWYLENCVGGVTWQSIIEAWGADDFEGRKWTIAFIDHMRKLLWDEPFDITFAARPQAESE